MLRFLIAALLLIPLTLPAGAADVHKLALQISDDDPVKMNAVLNVAVNVSKYYSDKAEEVEIQIVAFNAGITMLRADKSPVLERLKSFRQGMPNVSFKACQNTLDTIARRLQLTRLETQSFALTSRTLQRWRIDGNRSVAAPLRALARYRVVLAAQPNWLYDLTQATAAPAQQDTGAQYVVSKLRLLDAHRVTGGDNVLVAVIDSRIDATHPDLAGVVTESFDALGGASKPHAHGTAMASAIAAHGKLIGVAPKVQLLAVRSFAGEGESAQGTTFNILKGVDWAAEKGARVINMSFAGPADAMLRDMLAKAHARGLVLIAAVGNAGPKSPPLYPAADAHVIGVTATDAADKLLPQANRGRQVAVAAPGVDILAAAPNGQYQVTSGTSVAAAHASGVAALMLAREPSLKPDGLRRLLLRSAQPVAGKPQEVGAGVIDALGAVNAIKN
jgi:subtilisin family serine protease